MFNSFSILDFDCLKTEHFLNKTAWKIKIRNGNGTGYKQQKKRRRTHKITRWYYTQFNQRLCFTPLEAHLALARLGEAFAFRRGRLWSERRRARPCHWQVCWRYVTVDSFRMTASVFRCLGLYNPKWLLSGRCHKVTCLRSVAPPRARSANTSKAFRGYLV